MALNTVFPSRPTWLSSSPRSIARSVAARRPLASASTKSGSLERMDKLGIDSLFDLGRARCIKIDC